MITIEKIIEVLNNDPRVSGSFLGKPVELKDIVLLVVHAVGFHVNDAGEVCDPRPTPSVVFSGVRSPQQTGVRWRGGRKR